MIAQVGSQCLQSHAASTTHASVRNTTVKNTQNPCVLSRYICHTNSSIEQTHRPINSTSTASPTFSFILAVPRPLLSRSSFTPLTAVDDTGFRWGCGEVLDLWVERKGASHIQQVRCRAGHARHAERGASMARSWPWMCFAFTWWCIMSPLNSGKRVCNSTVDHAYSRLHLQCAFAVTVSDFCILISMLSPAVLDTVSRCARFES